jgi:hypothetical protein
MAKNSTHSKKTPMKQILLLTVAIMLRGMLPAQPVFQKLLQPANGGTNVIESMEPTTDGGMLVGGNYWDLNWSNAAPFITKIDASGQLTWSKYITSDFQGGTFKLKVCGQSADGGYFALMEETNTNNFALVHFDAVGNVNWSKAYHPSTLLLSGYDRHHVAQAPNGDYLLNFSFMENLLLLRTDNSGNLRWGKTVLGDTAYGKCPGFDCAIDGSGNTLLTGKRNNDRMLVYIDQAGTVLWSKMFTDGGYTHLKKIKAMPNGDFLCSGFFLHPVNGNQIGLLMRIDNNGNTLWRMHYTYQQGFSLFGEGLSFTDFDVMPNGDIQLVSTGFYNPVFVHTDANGYLLESRKLNSQAAYYSSDGPGNIGITADGYLAYAGTDLLYPDATFSVQLVSEAVFKMNAAVNAGGTCALDYCGVIATPYQEPTTLITSTGATSNPTGTTVPGITFSVSPIAQQLIDYCPLLNVQEQPAANVFDVFPNPVQNSEVVRLTFQKTFTGTIALLDINGRMVSETKTNSVNTFDCSTENLLPGMYLIRSVSADGATASARIIVR